MTGREKRVAAARAYSKIKQQAKEDLADANKENIRPGTDKQNIRRRCSILKVVDDSSIDSSSGEEEEEDPTIAVFEFDDKARMPLRRSQDPRDRRRRSRAPKVTRSRKSQGGRRHRKISTHGAKKERRSSKSLADYYSGSSLSSSSEWWYNHEDTKMEFEMSTVEQARMEHRRRRSTRSFNSAGPMFLSYRTSVRMRNQMSPIHSPIVACRLRFTPVAHVPTTPARPYQHTCSAKARRSSKSSHNGVLDSVLED